MFNFVTLGGECSPAAALQECKRRSFALPFDWVVSKVESLEKCFQDNFAKYHANLELNNTKTRLIDDYGFEFPHDYPFTQSGISDSGLYNEDMQDTICEDWIQYHRANKDKYERRIARFRAIMADPTPIIVLTRHTTEGVCHVRALIRTYFNRDNILYLNACAEPFDDGQIKNINTEINGIWNDYVVWKTHIDYIVNH